MIEELTPRVLSVLLLIVVFISSVLTLIFSAILLWFYRRAVTHQMSLSGSIDASGGHATQVSIEPLQTSQSDQRPGVDTPKPAYLEAMKNPWHVTLYYAIAGFIFALVFTAAARVVYPHQLGLPGSLLAMWIYIWPVVAAIVLIVPASLSRQLLYVAIYFGLFLVLILWASSIRDIPASNFGAITLPARSSATPALTLRLWLVVNGLPTLLMLLCFNRWIRAVAPLMLGFITIVISGLIVVYMAQFSRAGIDMTVDLAMKFDLDVRWLVFGLLFLSLMAFGVLGWLLARVIASANRRKKVNDLSLTLDALWLLFASMYGMWLIMGGLIWTLTAVLAFTCYKLTLGVLHRISHRTIQPARGLTFLRVFSLGRRSERLIDNVARYWRYIGSVQMITGPDVARSIVQPHQFLDFLSGRLASHFVRDLATLNRSVTEWDRDPDPDGRFRINNFFCHADTWKYALPQLVQAKDVVLMDLRSFTAANAGCIHELQHLTENVSLDRCLLIIDDTTDMSFLKRTLQEAWQELSEDSPNKQRSPDEIRLHHFESGNHGLRNVVQTLYACN